MHSDPTFESVCRQAETALVEAALAGESANDAKQKRLSGLLLSEIGTDWHGRQYVLPPTRSDGTGYLYLLACREAPSLIKIGHASNLSQRMKGLQTGTPFELRFIMIAHCKRARRVEKALHFRYREKRIRGEWFDMRAVDLHGLAEKFGRSAICLI